MTNTNPINSGTFVGNTIQLDRTTSTDTGVGLSGYYYQLSQTNTFTSITTSGRSVGTTVNVNGLQPTTYYRRVQAVDSLGNTSTRSTGTMFHYAFSGFVISVANNTGLVTNQSNTVSVSIYDIANTLLTGYNGTIAWSISGINTPPNPPYNTFTIPTTGTLVASSSGIYTFANALNITYPGLYQLTVYDVNDPSISGSILLTVYGVAANMLSGSISVTPQYTTGPFTVNLTSSTDANYVLTGPFATLNGTLNTTASIPTSFNTNVQGSYPVSVSYSTGFYIYSVSTNVVLDTTAPSVQILSPTSGATISGSIVNIMWTGSEFGTPSFSGYNVTVTNGITPIQQNSYQSQSMTLTLTDGVRTVTVVAIDHAGNNTSTSSTFTIDTIAPTIASPYPSQTVVGTTPFNFGWTNIDNG